MVNIASPVYPWLNRTLLSPTPGFCSLQPPTYSPRLMLKQHGSYWWDLSFFSLEVFGGFFGLSYKMLFLNVPPPHFWNVDFLSNTFWEILYSKFRDSRIKIYKPVFLVHLESHQLPEGSLYHFIVYLFECFNHESSSKLKIGSVFVPSYSTISTSIY
jgi:hypothetical protein